MKIKNSHGFIHIVCGFKVFILELFETLFLNINNNIAFKIE